VAAAAGVVVAVRRSTVDTAECSQRLLEEAILLGSLDHPKCLRLEGVVHLASPCTILTEFCANGNLKAFLRACRPSLAVRRVALQPAGLLSIVSQVTAGLVYVASKKIVVRELRAATILVGATIEHIKISKFARSRSIYMNEEYRSRAAAAPSSDRLRWMSPEAIEDQRFSEASDVWAAAVCFYEVFSYGRVPHGNLRPAEIRAAVSDQTGLFRLPQPPGCPDRIFELMCRCWAFRPALRPSFSHLEGWIGIVGLALPADSTLLRELDSAHRVWPKGGGGGGGSGGRRAGGAGSGTVCNLDGRQKYGPQRPEEGLLPVGTTSLVGLLPVEGPFPPISRGGLLRLRTLGKGAFGTVELVVASTDALGFAHPTVLVAVKSLSTAVGEQVEAEFAKEVAVLRRCRHPNLVGLLGVCERTRPMVMVLEYQPGGSLYDWLTHHFAELGLPERAAMARGVAAGMAELERMRIVHRDLAARNVVVGPAQSVKICDFGLSRASSGGADADDVYYQITDVQQPLPVRWHAPEVPLEGFRHTSKSDVYSFGVLVWELFAIADDEHSANPFGALDNIHLFMALGDSDVELAVQLPLAPYTVAMGPMLAATVASCMGRIAAARPAFAELVAALDAERESTSSRI
jgi:serine/threonine protein kinase